MTYAKIENGQMVKQGIRLPFSTATISFGKNTSAESLVEYGYLPIVGTEPAYDTATHKLNGISYVVTATEVQKIYDMAPIPQEELLNKAKEEMMRAVESLIQGEITKYNEANMVAFKDIDACAKYTTIPAYTHYQFCLDVISWQTNVWETARSIQTAVLAGTRTMPTLEEFMAELPVFGV